MTKEELTSFVPMTREEMKARNWDSIDILLLTGDAYVEHPSFGTAVIARVLLDAGYRVGVIAQPDWKNPDSLKTFGRPKIGCGVSAGNMDSMVCIYTAGRRFRKEDMYSPSGRTGMRPPLASIVYSQMCKAAFPGIPVVLGGVEVSMRRVAHYDYWQDKMRPSILADAKADILIYGMGEVATLEIFKRLSEGETLENIPGTARLLGAKAAKEFDRTNCVELPSYKEMCEDKSALMRETITVEHEMNPWSGKRLIQDCGGRLLVVEPPQAPLSVKEFDRVCELPYANAPHWSYKEKIPAYETIRDSIPAVRGCPGGCAFCGLVVHQGHHLVSRSPESILRSITKLTHQKSFHGTISDVGGAAGNIYGHRPANPEICKKCRRPSCMFPEKCPNYTPDEKPLMSLLKRIKNVEGVKNVFINSGIRLDLALLQPELTKEIILKHVSGHVKVAPEHLHPRVLKLMRKGKADEFPRFRKLFESFSREAGKEQYLIPLFISNFPGCTEEEMKVVDDYLNKEHWSPQQVQDYIPLPMTMGAAMYYAGTDTEGNPIEVNRGLAERRIQRNMLKKNRNGYFDPKGKQLPLQRDGKFTKSLRKADDAKMFGSHKDERKDFHGGYNGGGHNGSHNGRHGKFNGKSGGKSGKNFSGKR